MLFHYQRTRIITCFVSILFHHTKQHWFNYNIVNNWKEHFWNTFDFIIITYYKILYIMQRHLWNHKKTRNKRPSTQSYFLRNHELLCCNFRICGSRRLPSSPMFTPKVVIRLYQKCPLNLNGNRKMRCRAAMTHLPQTPFQVP